MNTHEQTNDSFILDKSIDYSPNSVVSKSILKRKAGNITLFSFDKDEELSEHTAPFEVLIQILDGTSEITIGGKTHTVNSGQCIILPAGIPHSLKAVQRFKMLLTMIKE